jgi:hypothetical protein
MLHGNAVLDIPTVVINAMALKRRPAERDGPKTRINQLGSATLSDRVGHAPNRIIAVGLIALASAVVSACAVEVNPADQTQLPASVAVVRPPGSGCVDLAGVKWSSPAASGVTIPVGQDVAVALVVPEAVDSGVFPWEALTSDQPAVLTPDTPCAAAPAMASLQVRYMVFRAVGPGTAQIKAAVSSDWRPPSECSASCPAVRPISMTVVATGQ